MKLNKNADMWKPHKKEKKKSFIGKSHNYDIKLYLISDDFLPLNVR